MLSVLNGESNGSGNREAHGTLFRSISHRRPYVGGGGCVELLSRLTVRRTAVPRACVAHYESERLAQVPSVCLEVRV